MNNKPLVNEPKFEALLDFLKRNRGFDFSGYKRSSLMRRVSKRMAIVGLDDFAEYMDYLEVHPGEFVDLFNTILINVTSFFRDPDAFDYLATEIIPKIIGSSDLDGSIRIWSAGCASGQEAYTVAMLFCEALGTDEFHRRVKIYATDVDEEALAQARQALFTAAEMEQVPPPFRLAYFTESNGKYLFRADLRRCLIFGRHDLVQDAPISHLDLLVCRNTLMYLNAETQSRIVTRLHFALKESGFLFLGKAEMLLSHSSLFVQVDLQNRVFSKTGRGHLRERLLGDLPMTEAESAICLRKYNRLRELSFDRSEPAQVTLDRSGRLRLANERARLLYDISSKDIGRPFQDLQVSFRPIDLRSLIDEAYKTQKLISATKIPGAFSGETRFMDVQVAPLCRNNVPIGVSICFKDMTQFQQLYDELHGIHEELETTNEELQSTNEELETTNEELQSTNEELETTNAELQSTNGELETTNEELESINEELETTNGELRILADEVHDKNSFLESILFSLRSAVMVLDPEMRITAWNSHSEDLWGLRGDEVAGKLLTSLDIGLPIREIMKCVEDPLGEAEWRQIEVAATNRRGRKIICHIRITPLIESGQHHGAVILVDESELAQEHTS